MSNVIRDVEKLNNRQLETAKRRGERELKNMENVHQNIKAELKKAHNAEIVDIQQDHHAHLDSEASKKEKVLAEMRSHLQHTKSMTEKELKDLKETSAKDKAGLQQKLTADRERINGEHELFLEDMNDRFNESSKKIAYDGKNRLEEMKSQMNESYLAHEKQGQEKIQKQTNEFTTRFNHDSQNYRNLKDNQDKQFKTERMATNLRQQNEMRKMTDNHTNVIEQRDNHFRKGLKDQDLFFEKKFTDQIAKHNDTFKMLENKNERVLEDLKTNLTKEITKVASRNDDPFYKFESLRPELKNLPDGVEVSVKIPEHSKEDVQLTVNGKEAIVSFNRRYADANKLQDGTINKVNKVESFTTRLLTNHVLNAKTMKSSYENGVMTYTIKKA